VFAVVDVEFINVNKPLVSLKLYSVAACPLDKMVMNFDPTGPDPYAVRRIQASKVKSTLLKLNAVLYGIVNEEGGVNNKLPELVDPLTTTLLVPSTNFTAVCTLLKY